MALVFFDFIGPSNRAVSVAARSSFTRPRLEMSELSGPSLLIDILANVAAAV
jgi:hypothetical protein